MITPVRDNIPYMKDAFAFANKGTETLQPSLDTGRLLCKKSPKSNVRR